MIALQTPGRLRLALLGVMLLVLVPAALLMREAWRQVRWEGLHQQQVIARELVSGINRDLAALRDGELAIDFDAYAFAKDAAGAANVVQRSPLSTFPANDAIPGLLGRFQLGADGRFSTPLLPAVDPDAYGFSDDELEQRADREREVYAALQAEPLVPDGELLLEEAIRPNPDLEIAAAAPPPASAADLAPARRELGRQRAESDAALDTGARGSMAAEREQPAQNLFDRLESSTANAAKQAAERVAAPASVPVLEAELSEEAQVASLERLSEERLQQIDASLDTLSFLLLDNRYFVLFRSRTQGGERFLQGAAIARHEFVDRVLLEPFRRSSLSDTADLSVLWGETPLATATPPPAGRSLDYEGGARSLDGELLHEAPLPAPFDDLRLRFVAGVVPPGPGGPVILWTGGALLLLTLGGFHVVYRAGLRQLALARQQQDFVSAVSHELRTPLTSIRMYSEMLRAGWADEDRKREYYDFIFDESERLSRLVANVLRLSRMNRAGLELNLETITVTDLLEGVRPALQQVAEAGSFELRVKCDAAVGALTVRVDRDAICQVLLNLVENAVKFAADAAVKRVEVRARPSGAGVVTLEVRDHGPGLPGGSPERLFELFYRPAEAVNHVPGTGIGLALVRGLVDGMGGEVSAHSADPGARFRIRLPVAPGAGA